MSARFVTVQWNKPKIVYDLIVVVAVLAYVNLFKIISGVVLTGADEISYAILEMRAWGTCAFLMLTVILCLGPLTRLDRRFLPLLYNRRHLGVMFFFVAVAHLLAVVGFYHEYGTVSSWASLLTHDMDLSGAGPPFRLFGALALVVFFVMAATSHDFWQKMLGPRIWKWLHMSVYLGYLLVVLHVAFGALQSEASVAWIGIVAGSVVLVSGLHLAAAGRAARERAPAETEVIDGRPWVVGGLARKIPEGGVAKVCGAEGEAVAVVRRNGELFGIHGVCAHQGGPLGEGRVIDGCLTCPWHGWQYRPEDGRSPPPFTEVLPTYRVRVDEQGRVLVAVSADSQETVHDSE